VLRYARDGKPIEIGLGGADRVTLKLAREKRDQHLKTLESGGDPREEKRKAKMARLNRRTFAEVVAEVIPARRKTKGWRVNANDGRTSSLTDWTKHLTVDCKPISKRAIDDISKDDVERIIRPYWDENRFHTARRVLKRIETVFNYAKAKDWRKGNNPASWDVFEHILQGSPSGPKNHHRRSTGRAFPPSWPPCGRPNPRWRRWRSKR
jgi:hypothetical protein